MQRLLILLLLLSSAGPLAGQPQQPHTDVYAVFSFPADERSWPALDSLNVGWVRLQYRIGETNLLAALSFFNRTLTEGYGLWLTLHHRDRANIADLARFDASNRGSFPPADVKQYKARVSEVVLPLVDALVSMGRDPAEWLVIQFSNEVVPDDVLPASPMRFFHGSSEAYLDMLQWTDEAVKAINDEIPFAMGGISSRTLEVILDYNEHPDEAAKPIVDWNDRLLREGTYDWADLHLYHEIGRIPAKVAWVRERWNGPLAATEVGGPDESTGAVYTEERQAEELPDRIQTTLAAGVDRVFWSHLIDTDIPGNPLAQTLGLIAEDWRYKPAFAVYQSLIAVALPTSPEASPINPITVTPYPNPFAAQTTLQITLTRPAQVALKVYDVLGREVMTVFDGTLSAGTHHMRVEGQMLPRGAYLYRIVGEGIYESGKLMLWR